MRKIYLFMLTTLDGFFEGPNHDISWHNVDQEFNEFAVEQTSLVDTMLFGRRTYQLFEGFWPDAHKLPDITKEDLVVAQIINNGKKIVFSKTLQSVSEKENWKNVHLEKEVDPGFITKLKKQPGKDIAVFGSSNLGVSLLEKGLLDEVRILLNPIVIGKGTPLFHGLKNKMDFKLTKSRNFASGNVLLYYHPEFKT